MTSPGRAASSAACRSPPGGTVTVRVSASGPSAARRTIPSNTIAAQCRRAAKPCISASADLVGPRAVEVEHHHGIGAGNRHSRGPPIDLGEQPQKPHHLDAGASTSVPLVRRRMPKDELCRPIAGSAEHARRYPTTLQAENFCPVPSRRHDDDQAQHGSSIGRRDVRAAQVCWHFDCSRQGVPPTSTSASLNSSFDARENQWIR